MVPIGHEKAPTSPEMAPICPEKARFSRKDFPPILSENLGLKPPFVSPPLDFPNKWAKLIPAAGFPAISESAVKVASECRCAILVHSAL